MLWCGDRVRLPRATTMRSLKLKRVQHGIWNSADGRFRFERWEAVNAWFVYERSPHPEDAKEREGFYDEPSFGIRFSTLAEAVEYAAAKG